MDGVKCAAKFMVNEFSTPLARPNKRKHVARKIGCFPLCLSAEGQNKAREKTKDEETGGEADVDDPTAGLFCIVKVVELGKKTLNDDGVKFAELRQYYRGHHDEETVLSQQLHEILELANQLFEAVHDMNSKGILHRDIKHENVIISEEGICKAIDLVWLRT